MKSKIIAAILPFLILSFSSDVLSKEKTDDWYDGFKEQRHKAFLYLSSHYNPQLQLISESEDKGIHWLKKEKPYWEWGYDRTFWVYSDNLFAIKAVEPYSKEMAEAISKKVKYYTDKYGRSDLFEIVLGEQLPDRFRGETSVDIITTNDHAILLRKHDAKGRWVSLKNVDIACYKVLQFALNGKYHDALELFEKTLSYWDGKGFNDKAAIEAEAPEAVIGYYSNYKIALVLFTARVLNYFDDRLNEIEKKLWEYQNKNGGITTLTNIDDGKAQGSANAETTSLALMAYNYRHINYMRGKIIKNIKKDYDYIYLSVFSGLILILLLYAAFKKYKLRMKK